MEGGGGRESAHVDVYKKQERERKTGRQRNIKRESKRERVRGKTEIGREQGPML